MAQQMPHNECVGNQTEQFMTSLVVEDMEPPIAHNQRAGSR